MLNRNVITILENGKQQNIYLNVAESATGLLK